VPLFIFARFHASLDRDRDLADAISEVGRETRAEPGCISYRACRALGDPRLFFIHSGWSDEAAFDRHAELPHTQRFLSAAEALCDQPAEIVRARAI
jgi:quinol monooxygenase YgiN